MKITYLQSGPSLFAFVTGVDFKTVQSIEIAMPRAHPRLVIERVDVVSQDVAAITAGAVMSLVEKVYPLDNGSTPTSLQTFIDAAQLSSDLANNAVENPLITGLCMTADSVLTLSISTGSTATRDTKDIALRFLMLP